MKWYLLNTLVHSRHIHKPRYMSKSKFMKIHTIVGLGTQSAISATSESEAGASRGLSVLTTESIQGQPK